MSSTIRDSHLFFQRIRPTQKISAALAMMMMTTATTLAVMTRFTTNPLSLPLSNRFNDLVGDLVERVRELRVAVMSVVGTSWYVVVFIIFHHDSLFAILVLISDLQYDMRVYCKSIDRPCVYVCVLGMYYYLLPISGFCCRSGVKYRSSSSCFFFKFRRLLIFFFS